MGLPSSPQHIQCGCFLWLSKHIWHSHTWVTHKTSVAAASVLDCFFFLTLLLSLTGSRLPPGAKIWHLNSVCLEDRLKVGTGGALVGFPKFEPQKVQGVQVQVRQALASMYRLMRMWMNVVFLANAFKLCPFQWCACTAHLHKDNSVDNLLL